MSVPEDPLRRARRVLRRLAGGLWQGMIHYGLFAAMGPAPLLKEPAPGAGHPSGDLAPEPATPPGHPERVLPDVPPTGAEEHLWRQLGHL
ncbi:DUF6059 family protein [Nonomuraea wenchangensis]|uniref:DUF6059 family protein n=1 Tax=Nonomuraea wenchangensis TaxID=568860 RepID=UPI0037A4DD7E